MKHRTILFVCTGNTCRSPMAEFAMKAELKKRKIRWYRVQSAGIRAIDGLAMTDLAAQALDEEKIPHSEKFVSRQLTRKMVEDAYAVICMTNAQQEALKEFLNVTSFSELCGREIPDPYGQGKDIDRATLQSILECLPKIICDCCPPLEMDT